MGESHQQKHKGVAASFGEPFGLDDPAGAYLLLDASLGTVFTGVWHAGAWLSLDAGKAPPAEALFPGVKRCLAESGVSLDDLAGFLYGEGPGSILGMRIAAMALRAWRTGPGGLRRPVYAFRNLEAVARAVLRSRTAGGPTAFAEDQPKRGFGVCSDARRGHWNLLSVDEGGAPGPLRRVSDEELAGIRVPLWRPDGNPGARPAPGDVRTIAYDLAPAAPWFRDDPLLRETAEPEPLVLRPPEYRKWM